MSKKYKTFDELNDVRTGVGFHFTSNSIMQKILDTGLKPSLGSNSSGGLGKEANDKTFISFGLEGVLQLYNRLLHAAFQGQIRDFQNITHASFVPDVASERENTESLTMLEAFEMVRQYMEDNVYIVFNCPVGEYERELSEEEINEVNGKINNEHGDLLKRINIIDEISEKLSNKKLSIEQVIDRINASIKGIKKELASEKDPEKISKLQRKIEIKSSAIEEVSGVTEDNRDEYLNGLSKERADLSNEIRAKTLLDIQAKRGSVKGHEGKMAYTKDDEPILDRVDFNEDKLRWYDQTRTPHNTHTRMIIDENGIRGIQIDKDRVAVYSRDGESPATGLEFFEDIYSQARESDNLTVKGDAKLLSYFSEYLKMVEKYKMEGLLYEKAAHDIIIGDNIKHFEPRECMDLSDISKYTGLELFQNELEEYYKNFRVQKESSKKMQNKKNTDRYKMKEVVSSALEFNVSETDVNDVDRMFIEYSKDKENEREVSI